MTRHKKPKKLKGDRVDISILKASDFPNAPPLLARMYAGTVAHTVKAKRYAQVADGHD